VGELEGDEPAADKEDAGRQSLQVQEVGAVDEVLVAGDVEGSRTCARGDQEVRRVVSFGRRSVSY